MLAAVDIGGTKITVSLADEQGLKIKIFEPVQLTGDEKTIPKQIDNLIVKVCKKIGVDTSSITAIGISTCSPFITNNTFRAIAAPNLCGGLGRLQNTIPNDWQKIPLEEELGQKYPIIKMENDCVSAVVAEKTFGAGDGYDNVIYVTWSTGIGCGAYANGHLIKGKNGNAPHLGPIYMVDKKPGTGNDNFYYLEALASGTAIARNYGNDKKTQDAFACYYTDDHAKDVIDNAIEHFVQGLISINYILDTNVIVLGGSVFLHNQEFLLPIIKNKFEKQSFSVFSSGVEILPSMLGNYLGDMAALSLVMPLSWIPLWKKNKPWQKKCEVIFAE